jgi:hypothetical protein
MKKKFYNVIEDATAGLFNENVPYVEARMKAAEKCEQIADEYAISFAEWIDNNVFYLVNNPIDKRQGKWICTYCSSKYL